MTTRAMSHLAALLLLACASGSVQGATLEELERVTLSMERAARMLSRMSPTATDPDKAAARRSGDDRHERASSPGPDRRLSRFRAEIGLAARRHGIPARLIQALIAAESGFDPHAVSRAGARGLMQVMPATSRGMGVDPDLLFDPGLNIDTGTRYLQQMLLRYDGDLKRALAAYNWGPSRADRPGWEAARPCETIRHYRHVQRIRMVARAADPSWPEPLPPDCPA